MEYLLEVKTHNLHPLYQQYALTFKDQNSYHNAFDEFILIKEAFNWILLDEFYTATNMVKFHKTAILYSVF